MTDIPVQIVDLVILDTIHSAYFNMDKTMLVVCPDKANKDRMLGLVERSIGSLHLLGYVDRMSRYDIVFKNGSGIFFVSEDIEMRGRSANKVYILDHKNISEDMMMCIASIKYSVKDCELLEL